MFVWHLCIVLYFSRKQPTLDFLIPLYTKLSCQKCSYVLRVISARDPGKPSAAAVWLSPYMSSSLSVAQRAGWLLHKVRLGSIGQEFSSLSCAKNKPISW